MNNKVAIDNPSSKIRRRVGTGVAIFGSAMLGDSLALGGWQGCDRLASLYLANHNLALAIFLAGAFMTAAGIYMSIKYRVRYAASTSNGAAPTPAAAA